MMNIGYAWFMRAVLGKGLNNAKIKMDFLCYLRAIQGHSGGIPISPELMNCTLIPYSWIEHIYHRGRSLIFQSISGSGYSGRKKENDRARQSVFSTALNPFGQDTEEESRSFDYTVPQKQHYETHW